MEINGPIQLNIFESVFLSWNLAETKLQVQGIKYKTD